MKKARKVTIPEERPVPYKDYEYLRNHAINSATWHAVNYGKNSGQIREKLYLKGYPREAVLVMNESSKEVEFDFVEHAIETLKELELVDDVEYAKSFVRQNLSRGKGLSFIRFEMSKRQIPQDIIEKVLEEEDYSEEKEDALERAFKQVVNSYGVRSVEDPYKKKQKIIQNLLRKGFSYDDITPILDQHLSEEERD